MNTLRRLGQRLRFQFSGYVYVGDRQHEGWTDTLPFYAFKCPVHGMVENYPHGFEQKLECPQCMEEQRGQNKRNDI